uniref:Uncharacterized protein n=1 Tax=Romanomermis culicivorax TaxID=13658 RepID=A0A915KAM2_ROMCU
MNGSVILDSSYAVVEPGKVVAIITWLYGIPGMCYLSIVFLSMYFVAKAKFVPTNVLMMNILIIDWSIISLFTIYCAPCEWAGKPVHNKGISLPQQCRKLCGLNEYNAGGNSKFLKNYKDMI